MSSQRVHEFWLEFCASESSVSIDTPYQSWFFGNTREMAAELADLVLAGIKFGTASLETVNHLKPDEAPQLDGYSVVTNFDGDPICVIRTTAIDHVAFDEVREDFAASEGEGDLSLEYWRRVHWDYFSHEAAEHGLEFDGRSIICCETFKLLFPR